MVCLKHWFFRYYVLIAAVLLAGGLYASRSIHTEDQWKVLGGIVGGVLSLTYFTQKQKLEEWKLFKEIFTTFNARYDRLNEDLNRIRDADPNSRLEDVDRDILFNYFNLCGEEYLYYRLGYIYPEVWAAWCNGMQIFYKAPRIKQLWDDELKTCSYYGLQFRASPRGRCFCHGFVLSERGTSSRHRRTAGAWLPISIVAALLQFSAVAAQPG